MLSFSNLSLRRGTRLLIKDASFTIYRGEKTGIVGANGTGKSSLLALVLGELQPDAGNFDRPSQLEVAHVSQELDATDQPAIEFVMDGDNELRATEQAIAKAEAANDGVALGNLRVEGVVSDDFEGQHALTLVLSSEACGFDVHVRIEDGLDNPRRLLVLEPVSGGCV